MVDQVNTAKTGLPYFTVETLNPTWNSSDKIVTVPEFTLIDQNNQPRDASLFDGKVTVIGFMFASCQGFCPFVVEGMKSIDREFPGRAQFVTFTVDPENDTPGELKAYAKRKGLSEDRWTLLTGDKTTIFSLAKKTFASQAFRKPGTEPNFIHSEHLYVIDGDRRLRGILNGTRIDVSREARLVLAGLPAKIASSK